MEESIVRSLRARSGRRPEVSRAFPKLVVDASGGRALIYSVFGQKGKKRTKEEEGITTKIFFPKMGSNWSKRQLVRVLY
jgi:hypothetical protein